MFLQLLSAPRAIMDNGLNYKDMDKENGMNGWQRLWAVTCFLLACMAVAAGLDQIFNGFTSATPMGIIVYLGSIWVGACIGMYVLGWLVAWVLRGFRPKKA